MRKIISAALVAGVMTAGAAHAATATATFAVTATVQATCSTTATALAFPTYTPGGGAINGSSVVSVKCTQGTPFTVALNGGATTGGTVAQRLMGEAGNTLQYQLYTTGGTGGYTTVWGDGTGTSKTQAGTGAGLATATALTVYGQIPDSVANQAAVPSTAYADTVTVTVTY
jgi:spore coat protein U-like protein